MFSDVGTARIWSQEAYCARCGSISASVPKLTGRMGGRIDWMPISAGKVALSYAIRSAMEWPHILP